MAYVCMYIYIYILFLFYLFFWGVVNILRVCNKPLAAGVAARRLQGVLIKFRCKFRNLGERQGSKNSGIANIRVTDITIKGRREE